MARQHCQGREFPPSCHLNELTITWNSPSGNQFDRIFPQAGSRQLKEREKAPVPAARHGVLPPAEKRAVCFGSGCKALPFEDALQLGVRIDHLACNAVIHCFVCAHPEVAVGVLFHLFQRLPRGLGDKGIDPGADFEQLVGLDFNIPRAGESYTGCWAGKGAGSCPPPDRCSLRRWPPTRCR